MQFPVFEKAYFLQSVGWAIGNSFWQSAALWLIYQGIIHLDKNLSARARHYLAMVLLYTSFAWFLFTIVQNYYLISNSAATAGNIFPGNGWILALPSVHSILPFVSIFYLGMLGWYAARFVQNLLANRILQTRGLTKAPIDFRLFAEKTAWHLGIKKKVRVWLSANVDVPCVTGFIKPVILLPAAILTHLSIEQTEAILLHELAHIKRNDYLVNFLLSVIELVLFFNPFIGLLSKAIRKERENCCDDWVMNFRYNHFEYASALLVLEEQRHQLQFRFALAASNGQQTLLLRIKRLFTVYPQTGFNSFQKFKLAGLCLFLIAILFGLLPCMSGKQLPDAGKNLSFNKQIPSVKLNQITAENTSNEIFAARPLKLSGLKEHIKPVKPKKVVKEEPVADYVTAFVNQELLEPVNAAEPIVARAVQNETKTVSNFVIKIEEQQSGNKETNTYYYELKNNNGRAAIKPLLMLNKLKVSVKTSTNLKKLTDTLKSFSSATAIKKRITS